LLARGDPHETLFDSYARALHGLAATAGGQGPVLRCFELDLLREIGYGVVLEVQADGEALRPECLYRIDPVAGPIPAVTGDHDAGDGAAGLLGATLQKIARREFEDPAVAADARRLLQRLIGYHLDGRPLNTRRIVQDLRHR
jgi:DNA repair protein RecO (recombination protein O)